ncbi:hypothetical protein MLD38_023164 [Melastoma candidum]|uniref:Uncharacterized protein n=1 Tax=Melastoma candidum TaxID=119954 RepID=A0ACB9QLT4_9MYRT|nr:hypothetical protein MLD38_023164 [Melastoma candidum]
MPRGIVAVVGGGGKGGERRRGSRREDVALDEAREKAMVVNLEYIKAIVTTEEVLILDPLRQEVPSFRGSAEAPAPS